MKARIRQLKINEESDYVYSNYYISDAYTFIGKDITKEVTKLEAIESKDKDVLYALAKCYHHGYGVVQNRHEAVRLYTLSSEDGNTDATFALAICYHYDEIGYSKDNITKAYQYYCEATATGHVSATLSLAHIYYNGYNSIKRDIDEATRLWIRLALIGNSTALKNLKNHYGE